METHPLAEEFAPAFIRDGGYEDQYEAFKASILQGGGRITTHGSETDEPHTMGRQRRRSISESLALVLGAEDTPHEERHRRRSTNFNRLDALPKDLQRIRKKESVEERDDRCDRMVETWQSTIKAYMSPNKATLDWLFAWRIDMRSHIGQFTKAAAKRQGLLLNQSKYWLVLRCLLSLVIYSLDFAAAFMLASSYINESKVWYAVLTLAWPFLALLIHAILALADGDSWGIVLLSLCGLKPFIDTWRVITGQRHDFEKRNFHPILSMAIGRCVELVFESIPQTCTQTYLIIRAQIDGIPITPLQYVTVMTSLAAVGFIAANVDFDMDTSAFYRKIEPKLYGWVPDSATKRAAFMFLHSLHLASFAGMRILSLSVLALSSTWIFVTWISIEFVAFTSMKLMLNTYWFFKKTPHSVSHIANILTFVGVTTFPIFGLRNPYFTVCGFQFQLFRYYTAWASGGMILIAMHLSGANETFNLCLKIVAVLASIFAIVSYLIKVFVMKREYNWMWWSTYNVARHFTDYVWDTNMYDDWGTTMDDHRACALFMFAPKYYLHDPRIKAWLAEKWQAWEMNPPSWFDEKFKASLHPASFPK